MILYCINANSISELSCKLNEAKSSQNNKIISRKIIICSKKNQKLYNTNMSRKQIRGPEFLKFLHVSNLLHGETYLYWPCIVLQYICIALFL